MLPKASRLSRHDAQALKTGQTISTPVFSLRYVVAPTFKCTVSVSKKTAKNAVDRNRIRRQIYNAISTIKTKDRPNIFSMIIPKPEIKKVKYENIMIAIQETYKKLLEKVSK